MAMLACGLAFSAETFVTETLPVENRSPVIQLYALSRPEYFLPQQQGHRSWQTRLNISNYLSSGNKTNQYMFIDGETWTVDNTLRYQLSKQSIFHLSVPWKRHGKGVTDRPIYYFHELLQLPQNGRTSNAHDLMRWTLSANNQQIISLNDSASGLGDIKLKFSWIPEGPDNTQINVNLKLPTGDFDKQTGSEKFDAGMSIVSLNPDWLKQRSWLRAQALSFWYGSGISYLGQPNELADLGPRRWALTVRAGTAWRIDPDWQIKVQLDSNSPLFDSEIRELGWIPVQIGFATEHNITSNIRFDFIVIEDLRPRVTPDIIFSTGLNIRF